MQIRQVAVLGAGVMGAQIAAHCVNAGIPTLLYDLPAKEGPANGIVDKAIANLQKLKPAPLATPATAQLLQAKNYADNLGELQHCDLIIEAIAERMDWKEDLYKKIIPHLANNAILVTNTSGLSVNQLASVLPADRRSRFCGVHFFNPPRYMHLAELIPAHDTDISLLDDLETWLTRQLGKGVVRAKDTPNFIANRIGVFSLLVTLHHTEAFGLRLDEVDALTGALIGRPKSATYRTMDVVGLDTMQHVVRTMQEQLKADPWHSLFKLPAWIDGLIKAGHLGQKSGQGLYLKQGKDILVFDPTTSNYIPASAQVNEAVKAILRNPKPEERMALLRASEDKQAQFLVACFRDLWHYCAYFLSEIAASVRDVDMAMRWGFGWQEGPFEAWQLAGLADISDFVTAAIADKQTLGAVQLPDWLNGLPAFYSPEGAWSAQELCYLERSQLPVYQRQFFPAPVLAEPTPVYQTLYENKGVRLWALTQEVAVLSFKSKANTVGQEVLDGMTAALDTVEAQCKGLIIYQQDAMNFSSGADLRGVASLIKAEDWGGLDAMIAQFQHVAMRLKYSPVPVVAALRGRALGGGCELMMHCDAVVAAFESYPGLVEAGVGVIPAGGGCKELAMRAAARASHSELMAFLQPLYEQVATAKVAGSAPEAQAMAYLRATDQWVMHSEEVLCTALAKVNYLLAANYKPPIPHRFPVAGREGKARFQVGLVNWLAGGFISEHDYFLANQLAEVITGGDVNEGTLVDEQWLLSLERKAFISLAKTEKTQARIAYLLETGKPLRN